MRLSPLTVTSFGCRGATGGCGTSSLGLGCGALAMQPARARDAISERRIGADLQGVVIGRGDSHGAAFCERLTSMPVLAALLLAVASDRPLLVFHGNVALVDDVYRGVLDLPKGSKASPELAASVAKRLRHFLHVAGYVLATVQSRVEGDQIVTDLDEGHLDKVAFIGADVFQTLRLKMDLRMPEKVLNKPELEKQLKGLADKLNLAEFSYHLLPSPDFPATGPHLDHMGLRDELSMFMPGLPYGLHT